MTVLLCLSLGLLILFALYAYRHTLILLFTPGSIGRGEREGLEGYSGEERVGGTGVLDEESVEMVRSRRAKRGRIGLRIE